MQMLSIEILIARGSQDRLKRLLSKVNADESHSYDRQVSTFFHKTNVKNPIIVFLFQDSQQMLAVGQNVISERRKIQGGLMTGT